MRMSHDSLELCMTKSQMGTKDHQMVTKNKEME